jgi:hypothetical protein
MGEAFLTSAIDLIDKRFSLSHCLPDSVRTPGLRRNRGTEFEQRNPFCCFFMYHISVLLLILAEHGLLAHEDRKHV